MNKFKLIKSYKKELLFWFAGVFLFMFSIFFVIYEIKTLHEIKETYKIVLSTKRKFIIALSEIKALNVEIPKISKFQETKVKGGVDLNNIYSVIKFFDNLDNPEENKFFILEKASKQKIKLIFEGKLVKCY